MGERVKKEMAKKPTKNRSGSSDKKSASSVRQAPPEKRRKSRKPVARNAAKVPVGRSARRQRPRGRYDEFDDRYYSLETFEEQERFEEPEVHEQGDETLSEFSRGSDEFFVDESREADERRRKLRDKGKKHPDGAAEKPERERKPMSPARRKLIHILSYTAILTVILIVGVVLSLTVLFKTQVFEVMGTERYDQNAIAAATGINSGQNIFLAPKRSAERRIKQEFPYIEEAHVGFRIPDTITIRVEEAVEGYLVKQTDTDYLVISTKGRILNTVHNASENDLPTFIGPTPTSGEIGDYIKYEDDKVVSMIESVTQTFADNGYQGITEIDATNMADITFTYQGRIKVKLGFPEDLSYKIRTAMTIITENLDKNGATATGILDVSRCNTTKRSYFNEGSINPTVAPTQDPSAPTEETTAEDEYTGEYIWTDDAGAAEIADEGAYQAE